MTYIVHITYTSNPLYLCVFICAISSVEKQKMKTIFSLFPLAVWRAPLPVALVALLRAVRAGLEVAPPGKPAVAPARAPRRLAAQLAALLPALPLLGGGRVVAGAEVAGLGAGRGGRSGGGSGLCGSGASGGANWCGGFCDGSGSCSGGGSQSDLMLRTCARRAQQTGELQQSLRRQL